MHSTGARSLLTVRQSICDRAEVAGATSQTTVAMVAVTEQSECQR